MACSKDLFTESELRTWISEKLTDSPYKEYKDFLDPANDFRELLRSGEALCYLFNSLMKKNCIRVHNSTLGFKRMENISHYISSCSQLKDFNRVNLFQSQDLYEKECMNPILQNLCRLKQLSDANPNLADIYSGGIGIPSPRPIGVNTPSPTSRRKAVTVPARNTISAPTVVASLQDDITTKNEFKYSRKLEELAVSWLLRFFEHYKQHVSKNYAILQKKDISLHSLLHSGEVLCELANILHILYYGKPIISKINHSSIAFLQMENIGHYLKTNHLFGIESSDMFDTPDLFEKRNMGSVITHIHILAKTTFKDVPNYDGPSIEESSQVKSLWTQALMNTEIKPEEQEATPETLTEEQEELLEWANQKLSEVIEDFQPMKSIANCLKSGKVLIQLISILSRQDDIKKKAIMNPTTLWHYMQNSSILLNYIELHTFHKFEECTAQDIVLGDTNRISSLLKYLRDKFDLDYLFISMMNQDIEDPNQVISLNDLQYDEVEVEVSPMITPREKRKKKKPREGREKRSSSKSRRERRKRKSEKEESSKEESEGTPSEKRRKKSRKRSKTTENIQTLSSTTPEALSPTKKRSKSRREKKETKSPRSRTDKTSKENTLDKLVEKQVEKPRQKAGEKPIGRRTDPLGKRGILKKSILRQQSTNGGKFLEEERIRRAQLGVRKRIIQELYDTEKNYISGLNCLYELIVQLEKECILSTDDFEKTFSNLEELLKYHRSLLDIIKPLVEEFDINATIGDKFMEGAKFFDRYAPYLSNYSHSVISVYYLKQRNSQFASMIENWEKREDVTLNSLSSYLVMPVQRLPRYILIFKDMHKYTPQSHEDSKILPKVITYIEKQLNTINQGIDKEFGDQSSTLLSAIESIQGENVELLVEPNRKFLKEGKIKLKQKGKKISSISNKFQKTYAFLLNDVLLACEQLEQPKRGKLFECKAKFSLKDLNIDEITETVDSINIKNGDEILVIKPTDTSDISSWYNALQCIKK